jgi:hypothetical protein
MEVTDQATANRPNNSAESGSFSATQSAPATGETPATLTSGGAR